MTLSVVVYGNEAWIKKKVLKIDEYIRKKVT
jgi:hypothetical protein